jgi:VanZ family protein
VVVYGSLYPWHFEPHHLATSPLWVLLHSWERGTPTPYFIRDVVVNIALYIPVGMSAYFVFRRPHNIWFGLLLPVLFGGMLSTSVELLQLFIPERHCSAVDVITNIIGSILGVIAALLFQELSDDSGAPREPLFARIPDETALALLFCSAAYQMAPFFPIMGRTLLSHKLSIFFRLPLIAIVPFLSAAFFWFVCGVLLQAANLEPARLWLGISLLVIPCQIGIISRQPAPAELLGAATGFLLFATLAAAIVRAPQATRIVSASFLLLLIVRGLAPFHFVPQPHYFTWTPFGGFLNMDWQQGMIVILEKLFYYGAAIWLLRAAGLRLAFATAIVAAVLMAIEIAQIWIPGRTAELTDPILAILIGIGMSASRSRLFLPSPPRSIALEGKHS